MLVPELLSWEERAGQVTVEVRPLAEQPASSWDAMADAFRRFLGGASVEWRESFGTLRIVVGRVGLPDFLPWHAHGAPEGRLVIGRRHSGESLAIDARTTPHVLLSGATGSGKGGAIRAAAAAALQGGWHLVPLDGRAVNTFSIQSMCQTFQSLLTERDDEGLMIIDSSSPGLNAMVSHSIFTQRFRAAGDEYDRLVEMPTFGHSQNHAGLQMADILSSGLIAPIASATYCVGHITGVHVHRRYVELKSRYARRLRLVQHRYQDAGGVWRGGFTVSDPLGRRHGGHLFHTACGVVCRS